MRFSNHDDLVIQANNRLLDVVICLTLKSGIERMYTITPESVIHGLEFTVYNDEMGYSYRHNSYLSVIEQEYINILDVLLNFEDIEEHTYLNFHHKDGYAKIKYSDISEFNILNAHVITDLLWSLKKDLEEFVEEYDEEYDIF